MKSKCYKILDLIEELHQKHLYKFLHRDFTLKIRKLRDSLPTVLDKTLKGDLSATKIFLLETLECFKNQYEKILKLSDSPDIYEQVYNLINSEFPVFPHDWDEYHFKKLMEKTFKKDNLNKINYGEGSFHDYTNKNTEIYKY